MTERGDEQILEAIRDGRPEAFDQLVSRYGESIFGFGMRVCGEREDARDVVQDTLLQAFRSLKDLEHPGALRSWLYRVASNACLMKRRRSKFAPQREVSLDDLMPGPDGPGPIEIPDASALPEDEARRAQVRAIVQEAITELPADYRIVLVLRDMEQLTTRETSSALDLPETTIKMRLHRARLMVRRQIEKRFAHGSSVGGAA